MKIWLFSALLISGLAAQKFNWETHSALNTHSAIAITDDRVWTLTSGGLLALDKQTGVFTPFRNTEGLHNSPPTALAANDQWVWIGFQDGVLQVFNGRTHHFSQSLTEFEGENSTPRAIIFLPDNEILAGFDQSDGLLLSRYRWDADWQNFQFVDSYRNFPLEGVPQLKSLHFQPSSKTVYALTSKGVVYASLNQSNLKVRSAWNARLTGNPPDRMFFFSQGILLQRGHKAFYQWNPVGDQTLLFPINSPAIRFGSSTLVQDTLFFVEVRPGKRVLAQVPLLNPTEYDTIPHALPDSAAVLEGFYSTRRHTVELWHASLGFGLNHIDQKTGERRLFTINTPFRNDFSVLDVSPDGLLYSVNWQPPTSDGTIQVYDPSNKRWMVYYLKRNYQDSLLSSWEDFKPGELALDTLNLFESRDPKDLLVLGNGELYICYWGSSLYHFYPDGNKARSETLTKGFSTFTGTGRYRVVTNIMEDSDRRGFWLTNPSQSNRYLTFYSPRKDTVYAYTDDPGKLISFRSEDRDQKMTLDMDGQGRIWVGGIGGITVVDPGRYPDAPEAANYIQIPSFDKIVKDQVTSDVTVLKHQQTENEDLMWVGTQEGAYWVNTDNVKSSSQTNIKKQFEPLYHTYPDIINDIECDAQGNVWFAHTGGVKLKLAGELEIHSQNTFSTSNSPLLNNNVLDIEIDDEGRVYLGTTSGLTIIQTTFSKPSEKLTTLKIGPNPYITGKSTKLTVEGLTARANVKILTSTGRLVRTLPGQGRYVFWDGLDFRKRAVPSGVYLVVAYDDEGGRTVGKLAVIRP